MFDLAGADEGFTHFFASVLRESFAAVECAPQGSGCCTGAVNIPSDLDAEAHDFFEIVAAAEERHHGKCVVDKGVGGVGYTVFADDLKPEFIFILILFAKFFDAKIEETSGVVFGNDLTALFKKFNRVIFKEGKRGGSGEELFKFNTYFSVIDAAVFCGIFHGKRGISGRNEPPDLTADGTAFGVLEEIIVPQTGKGRINAVFDIVNKDAVFTADIEAVFLPEFSELTGGGSDTDSLEGFKPDDLDIQIIIGV